MRILHVAPEAALVPRFRTDPTVEYIAGDIGQHYGDTRIDVTDLQFADDHFDAVACNHVLEHVADDRTAGSELRTASTRSSSAGRSGQVCPDCSTPEDFALSCRKAEET